MLKFMLKSGQKEVGGWIGCRVCKLVWLQAYDITS